MILINKSFQHHRIKHFCTLFLFCIILSFTIYILLRNSSAIDPFLNFNAQLSTNIWNLFNNSLSAEGAIILSPDFKFKVTAECTSIGPTFILLSAIIAWPSTFKETINGILFGAVSLFIINLIRILTLFYIGSSFPNYLDLFHYYIWQGIVVLLALGLWVFWMDMMVNSAPLSNFDNESRTT